MTYAFHILVMLLLCVGTTHALAQKSGNAIEITADNNLQWDQKNNVYKAVGNAIVKSGQDQLMAQVVTASYDPTNNNSLTQIIAEDNVTLQQGDQRIQADKITYNLVTGKMIATGDLVKIMTADYTVETRERVEYSRADGQAIAYGRPSATDGTMTVTSDIMTAFFAPQDAQQSGLKKLTARDNVVIRSATESVTGDFAVYDLTTSLATITGTQVAIKRGPNQVTGKKAVMNTKTGVSQIFAAPDARNQKGSGRVRALFYVD